MYEENFTSDFFTIVWESIQMFFMNLTSVYDRIMAFFGNERAQDNLKSHKHIMELTASHAADLDTITHIVTTVILWVLLVFCIGWITYYLFIRKTKENK